MMQFFVGNDIRVFKYTQEFRKWCRENLVLENPDYVKKKRLGKWTGNTPKEICLYDQKSDCFVIPFGCLKKVFNRFWRESTFERVFSPLRNVSYGSNIELYGYQDDALKAAEKAKNGVIVMPCGSGKTQTALEIVARIGGKCLWLTHTQDLLNQSMNRAKACYDLPESDYGVITGGKVKLGSITFATVQTMCKLDLPKYKNEFDIIIVDECHKCVGSPTRVMQFYKVLTNLSARYKFGLTATPKRSDGLEKSMFALLGDIIIQIPKEAVANTTCPVMVEMKKTGYMPNLDVALSGDGTINYANLVDDLISNENRLAFVSGVINDCKGSTLVLANRIEYLRKLEERYEGKSVCLSTLSGRKESREIRKQSLKRLNDGEIDCIFATYQLAKEGLDVPNLKYVVFATPEKDEVTVTQSAGRVGRKSAGKQYGTVIDFEDDFGMFKGWAKKRTALYKKLDFILTY